MAGADATEDGVAALRAQIEALQDKNEALHFRLVAAQRNRDRHGGGSTSGSSGPDHTRQRDDDEPDPFIYGEPPPEFIASSLNLLRLRDEIWGENILRPLANGPHGMASLASLAAACWAARRVAHKTKGLPMVTVCIGKRPGDPAPQKIFQMIQGMKGWGEVGVNLQFYTYNALEFFLQIILRGPSGSEELREGKWWESVLQVTLGSHNGRWAWRDPPRNDDDDVQVISELCQLLTPATKQLHVESSVSAKVIRAFVRARPGLTEVVYDCRVHCEGDVYEEVGNALLRVLGVHCPDLKTLRLGGFDLEELDDDDDVGGTISDAGMQMLAQKCSKLETLVLQHQPCITTASFARSCPALKNVEMIWCGGLEDVDGFGHVQSVTLHACDCVSYVEGLGQVHKLTLYDLPNLFSVSALGRVHTLDLSDCDNVNPVDVAALADVHTLNLSYWVYLEDVSALGRVHTLGLTGCHNVTDVAALGRVHTLHLSGCRITDVSALGRLHGLDLSHCQALTDVSALSRLHSLDLSHCGNLTDVSALTGVHTLNLSYCYGVTDVSSLGSVRSLNLTMCEHVTDVSALGRVRTLNLTACAGVTGVSALGRVHTLDLRGCTNVTDASGLSGVHTLHLPLHLKELTY